MLKIMIVDDEALPRIALRGIVEKRYAVVGEAPNAEAAMETALRTLPDIILVDIIMPGCDGLDFIEQIVRHLPMTRFVIISNAENVDYLKRAVHLNVFDYLVKGVVTEDSLLDCLDRLSKVIVRERSLVSACGDDLQPAANPEELLIETVERSLRGEPAYDSEIRQLLESCHVHINEAAYFCVDFSCDPENTGTGIRRVLTICREILSDSGEGILLQMHDGALIALFCASEGEDGVQAAYDFAYRCMKTVQNMFGIRLTAGISQEFSGFSNMRHAYRQAVVACESSFYTGLLSIHQFLPEKEVLGEAAERQLRSMVSPKLAQFSPDVIRSLPTLLEQVRRFSGKDRLIPRSSLISVYIDVLYHASSVLRLESGVAMDFMRNDIPALSGVRTLEELHQKALSILAVMENLQVMRTNDRDIIRQIKKYIEEHISERLSLEDIAGHVSLTSAYVGQYFKKRTGQNIRAYIAQVRIRRAKDYLLRGNGIHETAVMTGFTSDSYFIQCFKSETHMTPGEFIRKNTENSRI